MVLHNLWENTNQCRNLCETKKAFIKSIFCRTPPFWAGLNMSQIAPNWKVSFNPAWLDCPHIFNYYNLTITATRIYCTPKKLEEISYRMAYLIFLNYLPAKCTSFSLNILRVSPRPPPPPFSVRYINPYV